MNQKKFYRIIATLALTVFFSGGISYGQTKKTTSKKPSSANNTFSKKTNKDKADKKKVVIKKSVKSSSNSKNKKLYAYIKHKNIRKMMNITGIKKNGLEYIENYRVKKIPLEEIQSANFLTDYSLYTIRVMEKKKEYSEAADKIIVDIAPALKYISLPDNNLVNPLFDAAYLYMKQASVYDDKKSPEYNKDKAQKEYAKAYRIFKHITKADWYYGAQLAQLNTIFCDIRMKKTDLAEKQFAEQKEPVLGDAAYGLYWLIDAQLKFHKQKFSEALDSVIKSIVFDTKDIHTFPESLLLSAYCNEDMLDNYRARDIYFEIAKLFRDTPEGEIAYSSIKFFRERKLAEEAENIGLEKIFFDSIEDINKKIDDFIVIKKEENRIEEEKRKAKEKSKKNK